MPQLRPYDKSREMSQYLDPSMARQNERVLARVEALGGDYVWDAEVFAVTLMDVAVTDGDANSLCQLTGIQQIALDSSLIGITTLRKLASIPGLQSLVLCKHRLSSAEIGTLRACGPAVQTVAD